MGKIFIKHRLYEGLAYGPNGEIQFGVKAGQAPGIAFVDEDDPMVHALMESDADVSVVVADGGRETVFICSSHPDREFATKSALNAHMRAKGHDGAPDKDDDKDDDKPEPKADKPKA